MPFAEINNTRLFYRLEGNGAFPALVLSHSLGCDQSMWTPQMPDLLVEWRQDEPIRSLASPTVGRLDGEYGGHRTGDHRRDGMLLRRGPTAPAPLTPGDDDCVLDARELAPAIEALLVEGAPR